VTSVDVDVDVEKSRAQAYASMPASYIANYSTLLYYCLFCLIIALVDDSCLQSASKSGNKESKDSKSSKDKEEKKDTKDVGDGAHVDAVSSFVCTYIIFCRITSSQF